MIITVKTRCPVCKKEHKVGVPKHQYWKWIGGMSIQHAMPDATSTTRELLISGTCPPCFNKLYPKEN